VVLQLGVYLQEWLTAGTQLTVGVSRNTRNRYGGINRVIANGVNLAHFFPGEKTRHPTILFVGNLGGRKRGRLLLDAFVHLIRPSIPEARLWMVSEPGPPADGVSYLPGLSSEALAERYRQAWVFASPSCYEGFGLPYLEALASGTAVVATANVGSQEVLDSGRYGRLVHGDEEFPLAILEMLRGPELRARYTAGGLERARQLSLDRTIDQYEQLLESIAVTTFPAQARVWR
jgi:glycosyltransferase involved in cell wall biosynthesis